MWNIFNNKYYSTPWSNVGGSKNAEPWILSRHKLCVDFWLCGGSAPLTPELIKGQLVYAKREMSFKELVHRILDVQFLSPVWLCDPMNFSMSSLPCPSLSPGVCSKLMFTESVMPSNHQILCCLLLLLASISPSIGVFSKELALLIRWPKYWSFSFSIRSSNEYSKLISFRMHWFVLLAVQGTLKSLLQYHTSKASILQHSAFFTVQLSHLCLTTGKTIASTIQTLVGKVMSLLFNMLPRFLIAFLPRRKCLF